MSAVVFRSVAMDDTAYDWFFKPSFADRGPNRRGGVQADISSVYLLRKSISCNRDVEIARMVAGCFCLSNGDVRVNGWPMSSEKIPEDIQQLVLRFNVGSSAGSSPLPIAMTFVQEGVFMWRPSDADDVTFLHAPAMTSHEALEHCAAFEEERRKVTAKGAAA